jgi:hypothetical protein
MGEIGSVILLLTIVVIGPWKPYTKTEIGAGFELMFIVLAMWLFFRG